MGLTSLEYKFPMVPRKPPIKFFFYSTNFTLNYFKGISLSSFKKSNGTWISILRMDMFDEKNGETFIPNA
jgi:hypothetical protein